MYLVDSNVLIEAKNRYYAFDIAPGFWEWLEYAHANSLVCSIEPVLQELNKVDDELSAWANHHSSFFRSLDQGTTNHFPAITKWANSQNFKQAALNKFNKNNADYLLIAYALEHQHTLVTHERFSPNVKARVLIPNVCHQFNVATADTFDMLKKSGAKLSLNHNP